MKYNITLNINCKDNLNYLINTNKLQTTLIY